MFIVVGGSSLKIFDKSKAVTSENSLLFNIKYREFSFHCLRLVTENSEEFIYASKSGGIIKIRVKDLMEGKEGIVWECKKSNTNIWGLDLMGNQVFFIDYNRSVICKANKETGKDEGEDVIHLFNGYGIEFLSESEILTSNQQSLEIFKKQENNWISKRRVVIPKCSTAYSIFYEKESGLVYLSDTENNRIFVIRLFDFSIVKTFEDSNAISRNFGLFVDKRTGLLYVVNNKSKEISIFQ
ncbi:predicted protein [Naegleria gruberi]|uniref:Predicted protein n=1 Tax=Naegleria gruberi TaxID=5762 RepID=D2W5J1_NAEGR|nr:uncharacterized protein NAEGRDRAFT_76682 [Naegleria gruberi]EFC35659.1 predicted protein [Naegleria gruberi]|eukprot:XP_002668403.1 predicted protein [Naegleria gruberi strain NEG-M]